VLTQNADDHQRCVDTTPLFISELLDLPGLPRLIEPRLQWPIKPKAQEPAFARDVALAIAAASLRIACIPYTMLRYRFSKHPPNIV